MTDADNPAEQELLRAAVEAVDDYLDADMAPLYALGEEIIAAVERADGALADAELESLVPGITARLEVTPALVSLGFAAAPGVMRAHERYLLWFQRRSAGFHRLRLNLATGDPDLYDYFDMDWFAGAERRNAPYVYGPYVDYRGADGLVLTVGVPLRVGERFVGVSGADLSPDELERSLVPALRSLPGDAVIVDADRAVLATGSARWMPGERLPVHPSAEPARWRALAALREWTGWTLAVALPEAADAGAGA